MATELNMDRFVKTLSEILSEKYGCDVTFIPIREEAEENEEPTKKAS